MSTLEVKSILAKVLRGLGWSFAMFVTWFVASFVGFVTYEFAWRARLPPDIPGLSFFYRTPLVGEWWWLGGGLTLYGALAWPRMGRALTQWHVALLSAIYLDHIRHLDQIYLAGPRPWAAVMPPLVAALLMTGGILLGLWLWYTVLDGGGANHFSLRSLCAATAITAVVLGGLGEYARRERARVDLEWRSHDANSGSYLGPSRLTDR